MPFRKLPNTDQQRTVALATATNKFTSTPEAERLYPQLLQDQLATAHTDWLRETAERDQSLSVQGSETAQAEVARLRIEQLISHFMQVFQLGVARGEFERADRAYYGLDFNQTDLPEINSHSDILHWGQKIVDGDAARAVAKPAEPAMALPTAAQVASALANYKSEHTDQSTAKTAHDKEQDDVAAMRPGVDALIRDAWDTIEFTLRHSTGPDRRRKAKEWGVVYIPRPGEAPDPAPDGGSSSSSSGSSSSSSGMGSSSSSATPPPPSSSAGGSSSSSA